MWKIESSGGWRTKWPSISWERGEGEEEKLKVIRILIILDSVLKIFIIFSSNGYVESVRFYESIAWIY